MTTQKSVIAARILAIFFMITIIFSQLIVGNNDFSIIKVASADEFGFDDISDPSSFMNPINPMSQLHPMGIMNPGNPMSPMYRSDDVPKKIRIRSNRVGVIDNEAVKSAETVTFSIFLAVSFLAVCVWFIERKKN